ncbi:MAG: flippase [Cyanobacteria bacterium P01_A01_bin.45]
MLSKILSLLLKSNKFNSSSGVSGVITNTVWLFVDRIFRTGVGLLLGAWIARYLGAKQYGLFSYANAFIILFLPFATLGLERIVIRYLVQDPSIKNEIIGTAFWLKLLGGIASLFIATSCIYWLRQDEKLAIWLVVILSAAVIFKAFDMVELWFESQVQSKYIVLAKNTAFIITTLLKVALIAMQAPLIAFAWVVIVEMGLGAIGLIIVYQVKGYSLKSWSWSFSVAKNLLKDSWFLMFSNIAVVIYTKIDQVMLGEMVGNSAVGIYSVAARVSEISYFIPRAIASSVSPSIYAAKENDETLYYQRIETLLRILVLLSIAIAIPMTFFSEGIINLLFGENYASASSVLKIHIWASIFVFLRVGTATWFNAEGLNNFVLQRNLIGAVINIVLNLLLIPIYAELGAAIATLISYAFAEFFSDIFNVKTRKIFNIQIKSIFRV